MQAIRSTAMRSARAAPRTPAPSPMMRSAVIQRRFATKVEETAAKVKEAAESLNPAHHKPSSDVPWMVGSVLVFAPLIVWMTSPPPKKDHGHHGPVKEKFKPHLRLPEGVEETDKEAAKQPEAPQEYGGIAGEGIPHGEGDKGLRAAQEDSHEHQDKQKQGSDTPTSSDNHSTDSGLKGNAAKFQAAARGSQVAFESGGTAAAQDSHAGTQAGKAAGSEAKQGEPAETGYSSGTVPSDAGKKYGEQLSQKQDERSAAGKEEAPAAPAAEEEKSE